MLARLLPSFRIYLQPISQTTFRSNSFRFLSTQVKIYSFPSELAYHKFADECMDNLVQRLEDIEQSEEIPDGWDVEYASGVLTIKCGPAGTYVVNKQPPNFQIWMSSPSSGPMRFDFSDELKQWVSVRLGGVALEDVLFREIHEIIKPP